MVKEEDLGLLVHLGQVVKMKANEVVYSQQDPS